MVPYARKNGGKTKNCRSCHQGLYLEINFADRVDGHIIIYIFASASVRLRLCFCVCVRASASESVLLRVRPPVCVSVRASACPSVLLRARPCFCVPVRASACPSVLLRARPCFCVPVRASACPSAHRVSVRAFAGRDAKYSCVQCVGGKNRPDASCVWTNAQGPSRCTIYWYISGQMLCCKCFHVILIIHPMCDISYCAIQCKVQT